MEFHQLEYVIAVSKNRSFTRAALELSLTPPALSQQIKKLEEELGVTLFNRTNRNVATTPAGAEFVRLAQGAVSTMYDIRASMNNYIGTETGNISIGNFPAIGPFGLISLIASFKKTFPQIDITLYEAECLDLQPMLERGELDAVFSTYVNKAGKMAVNSYPLVHDRMVLVTNSRHSFAERKFVDLKEVASEEFIMPFCSSGAYLDMMEACKSEGFVPKIAYHSASTDTRFSMVSEGIGITFSSSKVAYSYTMHDIAIVEFTPTVHRTLSLVLPQDRTISPALLNFKNFCIKWAGSRSNHMRREETAD